MDARQQEAGDRSAPPRVAQRDFEKALQRLASRFLDILT